MPLTLVANPQNTITFKPSTPSKAKRTTHDASIASTLPIAKDSVRFGNDSTEDKKKPWYQGIVNAFKSFWNWLCNLNPFKNKKNVESTSTASEANEQTHEEVVPEVSQTLPLLAEEQLAEKIDHLQEKIEPSFQKMENLQMEMLNKLLTGNSIKSPKTKAVAHELIQVTEELKPDLEAMHNTYKSWIDKTPEQERSNLQPINETIQELQEILNGFEQWKICAQEQLEEPIAKDEPIDYQKIIQHFPFKPNIGKIDNLVGDYLFPPSRAPRLNKALNKVKQQKPQSKGITLGTEAADEAGDDTA